ncbi:c-type cytochrome [Helicobacter sp.]|uniref:c-type cytochrome n=1 Tax=Helicobacter sp. TaxID=218 RepID=UPI0025BDB3FE|nr:c-type cytochrome [Helicobacter sp.]MBR2495504.1 c-type cytochrome [Helicobacter sp.]
MLHPLVCLGLACSLALANSAPKIFTKCIACHGEDGQKIAPGARGGTSIAGLSKQKLIADLKGYRAQFADNGGAKSIMYIQAQNLSDTDIKELAEYISSLPKAK